MPSSLVAVTDQSAPLRTRTFGTPGASVWGGIYDDWLDDNLKTTGTKWYGQPGVPGEGHRMERDPHVRRSRDAIVDPVVGATWDFEPASKSILDKEVADFCRYVFFERFPWTSFLGTSMRTYIRDGFSLFEETDGPSPIPASRFSRHPGNGTGVVVTGLHYRPGWSIYRWGQSSRDPSRLDWVEQLIYGSDQEDATTYKISAKRLVRFSWECDGADWTGQSIFRSAWPAYYSKKLLMRLVMISHERNHIAQPIVTLPDNRDIPSAERDKVRKIFENFRGHEKGVVVLPGGYVVDFKSGPANTDVHRTIEQCNLDIALNVAAQFQLLGNKGSAGSYALANTQEGQFKITLDKHARFIQDVFNIGSDGWSIVERIVRLNYGPDVEVPRLIARNMPTVNWKEVLPMVFEGIKVGAYKKDRATEEWIRKVTYAPAIDEDSREEYAECQPLPSSGSSATQMEMFDEESDLGDEPEMAE